MTNKIEEIHVFVHGLVQGVSYRASTREFARSLGLVGWVRNLPEGQVEFLAQGSSEALNQLLSWAVSGPSLAKVNQVEVRMRRTLREPTLDSFEIFV